MLWYLPTGKNQWSCTKCKLYSQLGTRKTFLYEFPIECTVIMFFVSSKSTMMIGSRLNPLLDQIEQMSNWSLKMTNVIELFPLESSIPLNWSEINYRTDRSMTLHGNEKQFVVMETKGKAITRFLLCFLLFANFTFVGFSLVFWI